MAEEEEKVCRFMIRSRYSHAFHPDKVICITPQTREAAPLVAASIPEMPTSRPCYRLVPSSAKPRTTSKAKPTSRKPPQKDPKGGLTAEGRKVFARKEGSHLRPGVNGPADTPEKMRRKGSFLRRHFAHPRGPMQRDGKPTRLALSAHAWGEPVPKTLSDACKLAAKGKKLLDKYRRTKRSPPDPNPLSPGPPCPLVPRLYETVHPHAPSKGMP